MANNDYITTDCKLTVSKNTAKLDEEIFLYKNDRNIKLLIEIVDNKYRYKSDDLSNLLVKYKASYAQVKWYKNAEVKKEFPIQATDDGKVVFVIEGQLIDEDTELGDYDLQLRLLNESQESIRSLPIIKGAVHILKPLFEEGDIATVNSAVADVSMLSLDGDAIDTYNSDGTYNQTNWGNGDVISSAKLNKLEKVAKDNVDKVNKMPAKSIVEGGKIYLAKEDGTKLDSGTELPAGGSTIEVVNNLESDSTTAALSAAQGKALNTQYKDIANLIGKNEDGSDIELPTTDKTIKGAITELFQDVSNGKTLVANAITDKGVNTLATDTFQTMATNIGNISGNNSSNNGFLTKPIYKEVEGEQYRLVYNEDFDGTDIDRNYWIDDYMISRVEDAYESYSDVYVENSILHIRIKKDMGIRTSSKNLAVSSVQSAQKNGLHMPDYLNHDVRPFFGIIGQEGYYECRMKVFKCGGSHTAWWTAGVQDTLNQTAEFDITEILGNNTTVLPHNLYPNKDTNCTELTNNNTPCNVDLSTDFHTIGFLWEDGILKWFVDGKEIDSHTNINTPQYPMMFFLTAYRCQSGSYWGGAHDSSVEDVEFLVDYMKIYKKATSISDKDVTFVNQTPIAFEETTNAYTLDRNTGIIKGMPSYCYLNWSDGTRTEHWVKWERFDNSKKAILENGGQLIWNGRVHILGINVTATINVKIGTALVFENDSITIAVNDSKTITATVVPEDTSITTINYTVNNDNCTITQNGMSCTITGVKSGVSTVTATIPNTDISKDIKITVKGTTIVDLSQYTFSDGGIIDNWGSTNEKSNMQHSQYIQLVPNKTYTVTTYILSNYPDSRGLMTNKTSDFSTHSSINVTTVSSEQVEVNGITYKKCTYKFTSPSDTCYLWINKATSIDASLCSLSYM